MYDGMHTLLGMCDALMLSGGVSMGDRDYVPATLDKLKAQVIFHKVPQRPGRPILGRPSPSCCLHPGPSPATLSPVMVTARRIAVPVLAALAGLKRELSAPSVVRIVNPDQKSIDLWWHRPACITGPGEVELLPTKGSGDIPGVARSDGFVEIPPQQSGPGPWPFYSWSSP